MSDGGRRPWRRHGGVRRERELDDALPPPRRPRRRTAARRPPRIPRSSRGKARARARGRRRAAAGRGTTTVPACSHGEECDAAPGSRREPHSAHGRPRRPRRLRCRHGRALLEHALVPIGAGLNGPAGVRASVYTRGLGTLSAIALDHRGRVWATTSGAESHSRDGVYADRRRGSHPGEGDLGPQGPARPDLGGRHALRGLDRAGGRFQPPDGHPLPEPPPDPEGAGRPRLERQPRAGARRPPGD